MVGTSLSRTRAATKSASLRRRICRKSRFEFAPTFHCRAEVRELWLLPETGSSSPTISRTT
jgi:hypothetical protein